MRKLLIYITFLFLSINFVYAKMYAFQIPKIFALHINGIGTTSQEAYANEYALRANANMDSNTNMVTWDLVYNPTGDSGFFHNIGEVSKQIEAEARAFSLADYADWWIAQYHLEAQYPKYSDPYILLEGELFEQYSSTLDETGYGENFGQILDEFHQITSNNYEAVTQLLKSSGDATPYVLMLPHSQGNLYANELYSHLTKLEAYPADHLEIFGIASPALSYMGANFYNAYNQNPEIQNNFPGTVYPYITAYTDTVINLSRTVYNSSVLPSNIGYSFWNTISSPVGHSLIDMYLSDSETKDVISRMINYNLEYLATYIYTSSDTNVAMAVKIEPGGSSVDLVKVAIYSYYAGKMSYRTCYTDVDNCSYCVGGECKMSDGFYHLKSNNEKYYFYDNKHIGGYVLNMTQQQIPTSKTLWVGIPTTSDIYTYTMGGPIFDDINQKMWCVYSNTKHIEAHFDSLATMGSYSNECWLPNDFTMTSDGSEVYNLYKVTSFTVGNHF